MTTKQFENEQKAKAAIVEALAKFEALKAEGHLTGKPYDAAILVMVALNDAGLVVRARR